MGETQILIVEDESSLAKQLKWALADTYGTAVATNADEALAAIRKDPPLAVLLDLGLPPDPDGSSEGIRLLTEIVAMKLGIKVIIITGNTQKDIAVQAVNLGAYDFHQKPVDIDELKIVLKRACYLSGLEHHVMELEEVIKEQDRFGGMIAVSKPMMDLFEKARKVARTDYPVLIQGQSGTGKERLATAIHQLSERADKPFVIVDCGAIPENLLESELFGHEKGSFTGAHARQIGKLERAQKGTLVLDEIGELPLMLQVKLLRFLQEGTIERIGGKETLRVDARVIAITNVDLVQAVKDSQFREDLYYRLNVVPIMVPPLKDRGEDVSALAKYFLEIYSKEIGPKYRGLSKGALDAIARHDWPGNVREMQNRIRRAVVMAEGEFLQACDLELEDGTPAAEVCGEAKTLKEIRDAAEIEAITQALVRNHYNITRASQDLDVSRPTLHDLIKKHDIQIQK